MSKNIDMQKLHLAPKAVQILCALGLAAAIVAGGYFLQFQEQYENIEIAKTEEEKLKGEFENLSIEAANLENLQLELIQIEESIQDLIKQLPTSAEIPNLIQEMHEAAAKNGLTINTVKPLKTEVDDNIEKLPFEISVSGNYEQISQFVRDIGKMSRIVTLSAVSVKPFAANDKNKNTQKLTLTAIANTYKAVDTALNKKASDASGAANPADKDAKK